MNTFRGEPAPQSPEDRPVPTAPPIEPVDETAASPLKTLPTETDSTVPEDLRTPLRGLDLLLLVPFYFVTGTILYLLAAAVAHYIFRIPTAALRDPANAKASVIIISQALLSGATVAFLYFLVRAKGNSRFWLSVGWRPLRGMGGTAAIIVSCLFGGLLLAAATGFVGRFVDHDLVVPMDELFQSRQSVLLLMALGILVAPLVEETIFRGCVYPVLARRIGITASVIATGILFGLVHAPQLWPGLGQIAIMMGVGLVLTYVRARTGTVAASFCVHFGYNSAVLIGYYFATGGLHHLPS